VTDSKVGAVQEAVDSKAKDMKTLAGNAPISADLNVSNASRPVLVLFNYCHEVANFALVSSRTMTEIPSPAQASAGHERIPPKSLMAWISCCILGALYVAPFVAMVIWALSTQATRSVVTLVASATFLTVLLAVCARTWRTFFLLVFPLWVMTTIYASYAVTFGVAPGRAVALLLSGASWEEITGLLGMWQQKWLLLPILGVLTLYVTLSLRLPLWPIFSRGTSAVVRVLLVLTVPMAIYAAQNTAQLEAGIALNPAIASVIFFGGELPRARDELHGKFVIKTPFHAERAGTGEEVHVLVVGESARRASWSVYGYSRDTTPYLDRLKRDREAVFFDNAMSDANVTILAVPIMLTGSTPQEAAQKRWGHGNLLDLAKEAGYETNWLVNQDVGVSTSIGIVADHLEYPPDFHESFFSRGSLDEILLPSYRRMVDKPGRPRFVGMHVMGSHWEYFRRYPKPFQQFGSAQRISTLTSASTDRSMVRDLADAYDNTVLYTDWFLQQVIEQARGLQVPATVTFVPDHGEASPYLDGGAVGHASASYVAAEFEIPAFVWVNAAYRRAHPEKVAALERNASKEIRTHDVFFTEADLMGITWPGADPSRSFASEHFVPDATQEHLVRGVLKKRP
jgi:glucan phosphoethanolaminetransferase (alkaline phosphatase superfamily)